MWSTWRTGYEGLKRLWSHQGGEQAQQDDGAGIGAHAKVGHGLLILPTRKLRMPVAPVQLVIQPPPLLHLCQNRHMPQPPQARYAATTGSRCVGDTDIQPYTEDMVQGCILQRKPHAACEPIVSASPPG